MSVVCFYGRPFYVPFYEPEFFLTKDLRVNKWVRARE